MELTDLFSKMSGSVIGFITRLSQGPAQPHFPTIFGTGFFVDSSGLAATNRHVIELFDQLPRHPKTGESSLAAILFLPGDDRLSWQMLLVDVVLWNALSEFSSSDKWYGETVPDIGFVQLGVRDVQPLKLASEDLYLLPGMEVATIGYPMGADPMTSLGKLNQLSPLLRRGIVSSVFPFPMPKPHGFTMDIMQQGGSSGSPILRISDGNVVGMMRGGILDWKVAKSEEASFTYSLNTNISIAEPAHILRRALEECQKDNPVDISKIPTLAELREKDPKPEKSTELNWDTFRM